MLRGELGELGGIISFTRRYLYRRDLKDWRKIKMRWTGGSNKDSTLRLMGRARLELDTRDINKQNIHLLLPPHPSPLLSPVTQSHLHKIVGMRDLPRMEVTSISGKCFSRFCVNIYFAIDGFHVRNCERRWSGLIGLFVSPILSGRVSQKHSRLLNFTLVFPRLAPVFVVVSSELWAVFA